MNGPIFVALGADAWVDATSVIGVVTVPNGTYIMLASGESFTVTDVSMEDVMDRLDRAFQVLEGEV